MRMARRLALIVRFHLHDSSANARERRGASDELWRNLERRPDEELTGNVGLLGHAPRQTGLS